MDYMSVALTAEYSVASFDFLIFVCCPAGRPAMRTSGQFMHNGSTTARFRARPATTFRHAQIPETRRSRNANDFEWSFRQLFSDVDQGEAIPEPTALYKTSFDSYFPSVSVSL